MDGIESPQDDGWVLNGVQGVKIFERRSTEYGARKLEEVGDFGRFDEDVGLPAQQSAQRHDHLFSQGVDGRVGHLGKALAERVEERPVFFGENGGRGVVPHGADRFAASSDHRS